MNDIIRYFNEECIRKFLNLRLKLYEKPENLADFICDIRKETDEIARRIVQQTMQEMNDLIKQMPERTEKWTVERKGDAKRLTTSVGDIIFQKTLYESKTERNEEGKPLTCYLVDKVLGLSPNLTMTADAIANILKCRGCKGRGVRYHKEQDKGRFFKYSGEAERMRKDRGDQGKDR